MLLENFKPDNFPYSINLVTSDLIEDTVIPSHGQVLRKYTAQNIFMYVWCRRTGNMNKLKFGKAEKQKISNMMNTLK